jgi:hypothetical protein
MCGRLYSISYLYVTPCLLKNHDMALIQMCLVDIARVAMSVKFRCYVRVGA